MIWFLDAPRQTFQAKGIKKAFHKSYKIYNNYAPPPFEKGGAYCFAHVGRSVGMSVSLNLVQLISQERFAPEASNLVGR